MRRKNAVQLIKKINKAKMWVMRGDKSGFVCLCWFA